MTELLWIRDACPTGHRAQLGYNFGNETRFIQRLRHITWSMHAI